MTIKQIELNNFRIYKGYNKIDLSVSDNENIIIVSGKNGFGKTTFLMSLVWCMYGRQMSEVDDIYKKEIESNGNYKKYIKNSLNRKAENEGNTTFSVSVTFADVTTIPDITCDELKITRTYHTEGSKEEELEILIDGMENEIVEEVGKETFIRDFIMPKEIAKFFFFDAEKIVSLAEIHTAEQRKNLSQAYIEVLGIKHYQDLKSDLENYLTKLKSETATAKDRANLNKIKADSETKETENKDTLNQILNLKEDASSLKFDIDKLQEKLIKNGSVITVEELNELRDRKEILDKNLSQIQTELKSYYEITPFAIAGKLLYQVFEQVVEERKFVNKEFDKGKIDEISNKIINDLIKLPKPDHLNFDYRVQDYYIQKFKELVFKHLGNQEEQNIEEIELLHNFSEVEKSDLKQFINNIKLSLKEKLSSINTDFIRSKNEINEINKKIKLAEEKSEDALVKADRQKKIELEEQYEEIQQQIGKLNQKIEDNSNLITQHKKEINKITEQLELGEKNVEIGKEVENTISTLKRFIGDFKNEKTKSLAERIKNGLNILLHKKSFINDVNVEIIGDDIDIQLIDSRGNEINKDSLSKGEQQMYATALLKGLVDESNISFPVFIDSPMQKFDVDHSHNIVKHFYPKVSDQVIIFPLLKKEMSEDEFNILLPNISKTYLIKNKDNEQSSFEKVDKKEELFKVFEKEHQNAI
ncbi:DNA sulfur modification protein DndD [Capnocytophaga canimorsus]|uniref:DNA sulfur modification protein DndD n=1 Tax=Capnocytophaga canimorsus TaxID=28188 RepID=UPI000D6DEDB5|nr:DNA sulfur modification protein DndD [Capnocytophaga canimorsus]AWL79416.1 DNA sulfur modification protein DndD [Capnocytophaga canimorsus]AYW35993.1 DNA sulfur modification protein DndD [Capnocytophaga canimorsus]